MTRVSGRKFVALLACALSLMQLASAARRFGSQPVFSASLFYIYANDSIYWSELKGKLLRTGDTLVVLPGMAYKVWCEVLPNGGPRIAASDPEFISHRPIPRDTVIAHVELQPDLFSILSDGTDRARPASLWCDYMDGTSNLRTEVFLRPFVPSNTTCDYPSANALVAEGSLVYFTCTSWSGFPRPEHSCDVARSGGSVRLPAPRVSVNGRSANQTVTKFSMRASRENQGASIECSTAQRTAYDRSESGRVESRVRKVHPTGRSQFTCKGVRKTLHRTLVATLVKVQRSSFTIAVVSESSKLCELSQSGDYGVTVRCLSGAGLPATDHRCWISGPRGSEALSVMATIRDETFITEAAFNNSWAHQGAAVTCALTQQTFFSQDFSLPVPVFKESTKSCRFAKLEGGLQARCISGAGLPASEHACAILLDDGRILALRLQETSVQSESSLSSFWLPMDSLHRGSNVVCTIRQNEFPPATFVHSVPRFAESNKTCRFIGNSSWEVRAVCEFSSGHPTTHTECRLLMADSSGSVVLKPEQQTVSLASESSSASFTAKLAGPDASHAGGSIVCRMFQGSLFAKTFTHRIPEYRAPTTTVASSMMVTSPLTSIPQANASKATTTLEVTSSEATPSNASTTEASPKAAPPKSTPPRVRPKSMLPVKFPPRRTSPEGSPERDQPEATPPRHLWIEPRADANPTAGSMPDTTEAPRMSNQSLVTLCLSLLAAVFLVLLMSLPIHFVRRCFKLNRPKGAAVSLNDQTSLMTSVPAAVVHRVRLTRKPPRVITSFALDAILSDVCNNHGYRGNRRDGMPDIDQYSMYEFGSHLPADQSGQRKSVLTDALLRSQLERARRENRFSM